jgi:hypothetical protein
MFRNLSLCEWRQPVTFRTRHFKSRQTNVLGRLYDQAGAAFPRIKRGPNFVPPGLRHRPLSHVKSRHIPIDLTADPPVAVFAPAKIEMALLQAPCQGAKE